LEEKRQRKQERAEVRARRLVAHYQDLANLEKPPVPPKVRMRYEPRKHDKKGWVACHHQIIIRTPSGSRCVPMYVDTGTTDEDFRALVAAKFKEALALFQGG
jgi:hypothetical protein